MELSNEELKTLKEIRCYKDCYSLTKREIYDDEIAKFVEENWEELKDKLSEWFMDMMSDRIYHIDSDVYFYTEEPNMKARDVLLKLNKEKRLDNTDMFREMKSKYLKGVK